MLASLALRWSPVSPLALDRGDTLLGAGHYEAAADHFERVSLFHPFAGVRAEAALRLASLAETDLRDPGRARLALRRAIETPGVPAEVRALAFERLGRVLWDHLDDPEEAAAAFQMAYDLAPYDDDAGRRLVAAARARTESGDVTAALKAWERVFDRLPDQRALARISQASLLLADRDPVSALDAYEEALRLTDDDGMAQIARLGVATCRERLGEVQEALEVLQEADLPDRVAIERQRRLEQRLGTE